MAAPELGKLQHAKQAVWGLFTEQVSPYVTDCCVWCVSMQECRLLFMFMVVVPAFICSSPSADASAHHLSMHRGYTSSQYAKRHATVGLADPQGLSVADIAAARNIQETTVLSYLAEAIAAGYAYAWERFGLADSTLAAVRQAACAYVVDQKATASAEVAADSTTPCSFADAPAGVCDAEPVSAVYAATEIQQEDSVLEAPAVTDTSAADRPASELAPAVLQPLGRQCAAQQPHLRDPVVIDSVVNGSAQPPADCGTTVANGAAAALLSVDAAACIADLVSQRESLRPLKEHLRVEINFGVLRLALAHLLRLSAGHTA